MKKFHVMFALCVLVSMLIGASQAYAGYDGNGNWSCEGSCALDGVEIDRLQGMIDTAEEQIDIINANVAWATQDRIDILIIRDESWETIDAMLADEEITYMEWTMLHGDIWQQWGNQDIADQFIIQDAPMQIFFQQCVINYHTTAVACGVAHCYIFHLY